MAPSPGMIRSSVLVGLVLASATATTAAPAALAAPAEAVAEIAPPLRLTVASATPSRDRQSGALVLLITLSSDSSRSLRALADKNRDRILELRLDNTLLLEPRIVESFPDQAFQISGNLTVAETQELARKIMSGGVLTARIQD